MSQPQPDLRTRVEIVAYDAAWPRLYAAERVRLIGLAGGLILEHEHIGSTAVPGLQSKPVIDMMAAVRDLERGRELAQRLRGRGYQLTETGMRNRLFLRRPAEAGEPAYQLHIVELDTWGWRKERLMRDYLVAHPGVAAGYGALKLRLAGKHAEDSLAYTRAKTAFIQLVVDEARAARGLPPIDVWQED
jgi:GrpB-like predicted nucleotidyltransferase (UPF0157 family)